MKFLADENIDRPIVEKLRSSGFDVSHVDEIDKGISDRQVLEIALDQDRVILTFDDDFSRTELSDAGVIRLTSPEEYDLVVDAVKDITDSVSSEDIESTVVEISPSRYR